jgi:hypothetical protein
MTNLTILKHTHVSKFNTEQNNVAKVIYLKKKCNKHWKAYIYIHLRQFNTEQKNLSHMELPVCSGVPFQL